MILPKIFFYSICLLFSFTLNGQCTLGNSSSNGASSDSAGMAQSFEACSNGTVLTFAFHVFFITPAGINVDFDLMDDQCNVIWSVSNFSVTPGAWNTIDLGTGSGSSRTVVSGQTYVGQIKNSAGNSSNVHISTGPSGNYPDGNRILTSTCNLTVDDLVFEVEIEEALPVDFVSSPILSKGRDNVLIEFEVMNQINNSYFTIEHSLNGLEFKPIGTLEGEIFQLERKSYSFKHMKFGEGWNYYRIRQVDLDGSFTFSFISSLRIASSGPRVFPNPFSSNLNIFVEKEQSVSIYSIDGRLMVKMHLGQNLNKVEIPQLNSGLYFMLFENGERLNLLKSN